MSLESTTSPGTTDELLAPRILAKGLAYSEKYALVFSPEREDLGNAHFHTKNILKVLRVVAPPRSQLAQAVYQPTIQTMVPVSSMIVTEMRELLENFHRSVTIELGNEMKTDAGKIPINFHESDRRCFDQPGGIHDQQG